MFSLKEIKVLMIAPDGREVAPTLGAVSAQLRRDAASVRAEINHIRPVNVEPQTVKVGKRFVEKPSLQAATLLAAVRCGDF